MGHLVMSCDQTLYIKLINMLLQELSASDTTLNRRTYIQAIGAICKQAGHRYRTNLEFEFLNRISLHTLGTISRCEQNDLA